MDQRQYSTLMEALQTIPDPRMRRGQRYSWTFLLKVICCALAAGQRSGHAISHWIALRTDQLVESLGTARATVPSEATIWRTLQMLDVDALEACVSGLARGLVGHEMHGDAGECSDKRWRGQAIDGKELRGMRAHGQPLYLLSQVDHATGIILGQRAVGVKTNEITAAPKLLAGQDLQGCVMTMDALLAQREIAPAD